MEVALLLALQILAQLIDQAFVLALAFLHPLLLVHQDELPVVV